MVAISNKDLAMLLFGAGVGITIQGCLNGTVIFWFFLKQKTYFCISQKSLCIVFVIWIMFRWLRRVRHYRELRRRHNTRWLRHRHCRQWRFGLSMGTLFFHLPPYTTFAALVLEKGFKRIMFFCLVSFEIRLFRKTLARTGLVQGEDDSPTHPVNLYPEVCEKVHLTIFTISTFFKTGSIFNFDVRLTNLHFIMSACTRSELQFSNQLSATTHATTRGVEPQTFDPQTLVEDRVRCKFDLIFILFK